MKRVKTILVDVHKCKLTLIKDTIQENNFVISKSHFERMDKFGTYINSYSYKEERIEIEKVSLINIGSNNNPRMVLGFTNGGICDKALQQMYSIVEVTLV